MVNQGIRVEPPRVEAHRVEQRIPREREPQVVLENRHQYVDELIQQIRRDDMAANNNLTAMVERIMVKNGVDVVLLRPDYTSPLSEYVLQEELPIGEKSPNSPSFLGIRVNPL